jgi:hypothetical protein
VRNRAQRTTTTTISSTLHQNAHARVGEVHFGTLYSPMTAPIIALGAPKKIPLRAFWKPLLHDILAAHL